MPIVLILPKVAILTAYIPSLLAVLFTHELALLLLVISAVKRVV